MPQLGIINIAITAVHGYPSSLAEGDNDIEIIVGVNMLVENGRKS